MHLDDELDYIQFGPRPDSIHSLKGRLESSIAYNREHYLDGCYEVERAVAPPFSLRIKMFPSMDLRHFSRNGIRTFVPLAGTCS